MEQQTILRRYTLGGVFGNATGQVMLNPIAMRIERLLVTMMTASVPTTPELDALFKLLHEASDPADRSDAEQRIWAIWSGHEDADAAQAMRNAIAALDSGDLTAADRELTMMVERWPNWAETRSLSPTPMLRWSPPRAPRRWSSARWTATATSSR